MGASAVRIIRLRLGGLAALGVGTLLFAGATALGLAYPSVRVPVPLGYAIEQRAVAAAEAEPFDAAAFETLNREVLAQMPMSAEAWLRLAWAADRRGDAAARNAHLARTYTLSPYGPFIIRQRQKFAYDRWSSLTPDLRRQVMEETRHLVRTRHDPGRGLGGQITDRTGRLAFGMVMLVETQAKDREAAASRRP